MNPALTLATLLIGQASASAVPRPLIVGIVRDQNGDPIGGARVESGSARTETAADGTFALEGDAGQSVRISCAYCRGTSLVAGSDPIVVIVRRYEAVAHDGPTEHDLSRLPTAHAETLISLRPFEIVNDSARVLPGTRVAERGDAYHGAPVSLDEVPQYDIAADLSPLLSAPAYGVRDLFFAPRGDAYRYGDQSGAGYIDVRSDDVSGARGIAGGDLAFAFSTEDGAFKYSGSTFSNDLERRRYAHAGTALALPRGSIDASFVAVSNTLAPAFGDYAQTSNIGAHLQYNDSAKPWYVTFSGARGSYSAVYSPALVDSDWTDLDIRAGAQRTTETTRSFIEAATRFSAGMYNSRRSISGTITTQDLAGGFAWNGSRFDGEVDAGVYAVRSSAFFSSDLYPAAQFIVPSVALRYHPNRAWRATIRTDSTYALASLLERLSIATDAVPVVREGGEQLDVTYGDDSRFTATATALRVRRTGVQRGELSGLGVSSAWQIAPQVSLRAWIYRVVPGIAFDARGFTFDSRIRTATAASAWLTYETPSDRRLDVFFRRSLQNWIPYEHVDATFSSPVSRSLRWFVSSEDRHHARYVDFGLQFDR